jgi:hypothetical protein
LDLVKGLMAVAATLLILYEKIDQFISLDGSVEISLQGLSFSF